MSTAQIPYPRLPAPPGATIGEPASSDGARLVRWLLAHDGVTGTLDDAQCERAHHATTAALAQRVVLGRNGDAESTPALVYDRLEELRRLLRLVLTDRGLSREGPPIGPIDAPPKDEDGGRKAPLLPVRPSHPPACAHAVPDIRF